MKLRKTQTKAFASLVSAVLLLAFEIWAYVQTLGFKTPKSAKYVKPATFPQFMICGMAIFTVILLVQSCLKVSRGMSENDYENAPAESLNPVKNRGVATALFVILLCVLYTALFDKLGYVPVSALVSLVNMVLIGKRDPKVVVPVSILVPLVMWFIFYKLLTVNIPMGVLQPLRDLVDKI